MSYSDDIHTLEIDSVELSFSERQILTNVYLRIDTGKITALLGSNGSGKSCLMRILSGDLNPTYKSIRIDSKWYKKLSNTQVLYLSQSCCIPKSLTVKRVFSDFNLSFEDFIHVFPEFSNYSNKHIRELSGGEARIIEIYTILRSDSMFVMLDEPFSQIMPLHITTIKSIIEQEKERKGILLTDHMYNNVIDIADSMYIISNQTVYMAKEVNDLVMHGYINQ